ncbi:MAG: DsbA family protein [Alphaproteobacteria bacterium]
MSKTPKATSGNTATQFIVPALVGAGVAAAAFGIFVALDPGRAPAPEPVALVPLPVMPGKTASPAVADEEGQKALIEKTVEAYLLKNPQILMRMSEALERQQSQDQNEQLQKTIAENSDDIYRDTFGLTVGNPDGDVTIVEFSDYNCPYCKRAFNSIKQVLSVDSKVRVVLKEFPIFGEQSESIARVAIAAKNQGRYFDMHTALLKSPGRNNEKSALLIAEKLGLDMDKLRKDMGSDEVRKVISETRILGNKLGIRGTPFFLVGDKVIPGAPDDLFQVFKGHIADIRKNGCNVSC